jgi:predicted transcriptional regulator
MHASLLLDAAFDFGLSASEFKVFFHLTRLLNHNQQVAQSIKSIATKCNLGRTTVIESLFSLLQMRMIRRLPSGRGYIYNVLSAPNWVKRAANDTSEKQTSLENELDQNLNYQQFEPDSSTTPWGGSAESVAVALKQSEKRTLVQKTDCPKIAVVTEPEFGDVFEKVEAARGLGCNIGTPWLEGVMMVAVDGAILSVEEFMQRTLNSFKQILQPCERGLNLCRDAIAVIKRKIQIAKRDNLEACLT